jgi:hypothetical protein
MVRNTDQKAHYVILKLLFYLVPVSPKYLSQHPILDTPSAYVPPSM